MMASHNCSACKAKRKPPSPSPRVLVHAFLARTHLFHWQDVREQRLEPRHHEQRGVHVQVHESPRQLGVPELHSAPRGVSWPSEQKMHGVISLSREKRASLSR